MCGLLPNGLRNSARKDQCTVSCIFTNLGRVLIRSPLPKHDGSLVAGDAVLERYYATERYGPLEALSRGSAKTLEMSVLTLRMLWKMVTLEVSVKNLSGPYRKKYGFRTLMNYLQEKRYKSKYSEDLWRTVGSVVSCRSSAARPQRRDHYRLGQRHSAELELCERSA